MDGGFFLCPDAWEFLLPAEICHLRNAMAVCRKRWDLLTLTPMGCALLPEPAAVTAGILLLPGDCPRSDLRAGTVVTYGLSPRDSITLSSLREPVLCVQRTLPLLCGCRAQKASTEFFAMDTVMQLTAYGAYADAAVDAAEIEIARLDAKLSAQNVNSEIAKLNAGGFCEDDETLRVLASAYQIAALTEGAYDPTVYPLMQLWGFGTDHAQVPQQAAIETALEAVGYEKLPVVKAPYQLPEGMAIDLGGIGKGFAAETLRKCLHEQGIQSAVLSLGGNVTLLGRRTGITDV